MMFRKKPQSRPGLDLFRVRRASQFPHHPYTTLSAEWVGAVVLMCVVQSCQNWPRSSDPMNEAYVLVAIILCVWLLVKLLPGMEP